MDASQIKLEHTLQLLLKLKNKSLEILISALPILKDLTDDENSILGEVIFKLPDLEPRRENVNEWLQQWMMDRIKDADIIKNEVKSFSKYCTLGPRKLEKNVKKYPYLGGAWYGDMYDGKEGNEAFSMIFNELNEQISFVSEDILIRECVNHFSPP